MEDGAGRRARTIDELAILERRDPLEMYRLVLDAGVRVFQRKHRLGCGFPGCKKRCCSHPRGQMRLVWPESGRNNDA